MTSRSSRAARTWPQSARRGLEVRSPTLGDFTVHAPPKRTRRGSAPVDVVLVAVKAYDNADALPMICADGRARDHGADAPERRRQRERDRGAASEKAPVVGGTTYIATALAAPGLIEQTGTHRRIVFGEVFGSLPRIVATRAGDPRGARRR